jgi:hypothetical protein
MKHIVSIAILLLVMPFIARPLNIAPSSHSGSPSVQGSGQSVDSSRREPREAIIFEDSTNSIPSFLANEGNALPALNPTIDTPLTDSAKSANDTLVFDLSQGFVPKHRHPHVFSIPAIENSRQVPYTENFSMLDFNRVTGFFLGLGSPGLEDIGPHDELGLGGGFGYGFASKRWEYRMDGEFRLPLANVSRIERDTSVKHALYMPPTIAIGGGFHNITSTDDDWREGRLENAVEAFLARQDFRDYYKLAGWDGFIAFRPRRDEELRIEWRSDYYSSLSQTVFYGRFGGNKAFPPNPVIPDGEMHSVVATWQREGVHTRIISVPNMWGDTVDIEQLEGKSQLIQAELGHMPGSDFGFNRYLLDLRKFQPIMPGLNIDARFRFEATTGDMLPEKMEYLGGPGSLPGIDDKSLVGNRLMLLNTEVRFNLEMLSSSFHAPDLNLIIYNDFGMIGNAGPGESILDGFNYNSFSSVVYNVGAGIGWTNGLQVGASWRTDIKSDPRWMVRLQRPF